MAEVVLTPIEKRTVDEWLDLVDYEDLEFYVPTEFALMFMNFIKLVNGDEGEENKTPVVHLKMLDKIGGKKQRVANLCFRGAAKTTLMFEYLILFIAFFGYIPGFGKVEGMIYVSDSMDNGVKSARKNIEFRYHKSDFLQENIPGHHFTDNYIEFNNLEGHRLGCKMFGAKTGIRGTKIFGKRPVLAVLDDLVSDEDAKSAAAMNAINDTVYNGIDYALHPTRRKIIFNGTPFNKGDILYSAVESGSWDVNVWPVCERFPCEPEEFRGAWDDRFTYEFVKRMYEDAVLDGRLASFNQEMMLRISSAEERLIQDSEIKWYERASLLKNKGRFNFYITTDFATSDKETADLNVISVWAVNSNGDYFWVDGIAKRQTMEKTIHDLFRLVQEYRVNLMSVGIEITGQQNAFIQWIQKEQMDRNIWFNFAMEKGKPGIRPVVNKLSRFNMVVPWFKAGKMYFPEEMKKSQIMGVFMSQIQLATINGLKGKDDALDTISMLQNMNVIRPSEDSSMVKSDDSDRWDFDEDDGTEDSGLSSYIV